MARVSLAILNRGITMMFRRDRIRYLEQYSNYLREHFDALYHHYLDDKSQYDQSLELEWITDVLETMCKVRQKVLDEIKLMSDFEHNDEVRHIRHLRRRFQLIEDEDIPEEEDTFNDYPL